MQYFRYLCYCVINFQLLVLSLHGSDQLPIADYRDYRNIEQTIRNRGFISFDDEQSNKVDGCAVFGVNDSYLFCYQPHRGCYTVPQVGIGVGESDEDTSDNSSDESTEKPLLFSGQTYRVFKKKNEKKEPELWVERQGKEECLIPLSCVPDDEAPLRFKLKEREIIIFNGRDEQFGYVRLNADAPSIHYIYTLEDIRDNSFDLGNFRGHDSKLYFLKTPSGSWPEIWTFDISNATLERVKNHPPHYIVDFKFCNLPSKKVVTVVKHKHHFQDYISVGDGVFEGFPPHQDENPITKASPGHHGWLIECKEGLYTKAYLCPYDDMNPSKGTLIYNERKFLQQQHPKLFSTLVEPTSIYIPNKQDQDVQIPVHIYEPKTLRAERVILNLHGGPEAYHDAEYFPHIQYFVNQLNCIVVDINYRGSKGYSQKLASLAGKIESGAMSDVLSVMDYIKSTHSGKSALKFGLYGESWGAFLTALLLTSKEHSSQFVGGVAASAFYDMQEDFEHIKEKQGEIFAASAMRSRFGLVPSVDTEQSKRLSITNRLGDLRVPLYVIHGRKDTTCPIKQVTLLQEAYKKIGGSLIKVKIYDDSEHELSSKDSHDAFATMVRFFQEIMH